MNYKYTIHINQLAVLENGFDLDIIDLAIFDEIKDFAHSGECKITIINGEPYYWITPQKIMSDLPLLKIKTRQSVYNRLDKLIKAGILKRDDSGKNALYAFGKNYVKLIYTCKNNFTQDVNEILHDDVNEILHDNNNYNININYNQNNNKEKNIIKKDDTDLFGNDTDKSKKHLFAYSTYGRMVNDDDYTEFLALPEFKKPDYQDIDLVYYYNAVKDWSDTSDTKRTDRGWLATIKQFIRSDIERKTLHKITASVPQISDEELINYLHKLDV